MNSATDRRTQIRERKALIEARFAPRDAVRMMDPSRDARTIDSHLTLCPACRADIAIGGARFACRPCGASGGGVAWVMMARGVSMGHAMDLIERYLSGCAEGPQ